MQVQFNSAGSFAGDAGFTYDVDTDLLTATSIAGEGGNLSNLQISQQEQVQTLLTLQGISQLLVNQT
jgi:hypothetical protein